MTFDELELDPRCLNVLHTKGIVEPTPIQAQAIPVIREGKDVLALAQTGTGKTLAYALPALSMLAAGKIRSNMLLVVAPTRELAVQVEAVVNEFGKPLRIRSVAVYGGVPMDEQTQALKRGRAVIVATPGRLLDHMRRGNVQFKNLDIFVLDEADRMLDMGFMPDILELVKHLPEERQTILCSATFPDEMARLAQRLQRDPVRIAAGSVAKPVDAVRQRLYAVHEHDKLGLIEQIIDEERMDSAIVFLRTKHRTDRVARALKRKGHKAAAIHGDRSQKQRQAALDGFKQGRYKFLVATDVAARGLDIQGISHVINYDIPENPDDYIHRIGRTARAKQEGDAVTFVAPDQYNELAQIERAMGRTIPRVEWPGAAPLISLYGAEEEAARQRRGMRRPAKRRSLLRRR